MYASLTGNLTIDNNSLMRFSVEIEMGSKRTVEIILVLQEICICKQVSTKRFIV